MLAIATEINCLRVFMARLFDNGDLDLLTVQCGVIDFLGLIISVQAAVGGSHFCASDLRFGSWDPGGPSRGLPWLVGGCEYPWLSVLDCL